MFGEGVEIDGVRVIEESESEFSSLGELAVESFESLDGGEVFGEEIEDIGGEAGVIGDEEGGEDGEKGDGEEEGASVVGDEASESLVVAHGCSDFGGGITMVNVAGIGGLGIEMEIELGGGVLELAGEGLEMAVGDGGGNFPRSGWWGGEGFRVGSSERWGEKSFAESDPWEEMFGWI